MIASAVCAADAQLLERLDDFFSESGNTETIRCFIENDKFISEDMQLYSSNVVDKGNPSGAGNVLCQRNASTEVCLNLDTDSELSLKLYAAFHEYSVILEGLLDIFFERELASGNATKHSDVAEAVMKEWRKTEGSFRYMCTVYIAAALEFDAFRELLADFQSIRYYEMSDSEETYDEKEDHE